tara:strand:- start:805 stop:1719 length:915 start_codon:yes stop_codon:yes gene_type:complete
LKKNLKILIAGGTGFIGYHLAVKALKKKFSVTSISTKKPVKKRYNSKVKYIICDTSNFNLLSKKLNIDYDVIVNLSGYVNHSEKKKTYLTHYKGCKNLAKFFLKKDIKAFIQIGSGLEYGNSKSPQIESAKCSPRSVYSLAKYKSTVFLRKLFFNYNFPVTILRLYQAYGPKQDTNRLIPSVIEQSFKGEKIPCSHGLQLRDFLYIDDLTDLIFKIIHNEKAKGEIFNVGSSKPIKIKEVIKKIVKIVGSGKPNFGAIKIRKDETMKMYPSIKKAKKILNWTPKNIFTTGIKKTIRSYRNDLCK